MKVTHVQVLRTNGERVWLTLEDFANTHVQVLRTNGERVWLTLEDFAKLFEPITVTDGRTYERKEIGVRTPTGCKDTKGESQ